MTSLSREPDPSSHRVEHRIVIPNHVPMVALLGSRDSVLRAVEEGFPTVDVHVRGNEIAVGGPPGDVALADEVAGDLADGQFRLIFNSGPRAGQSVFHVHGHVIAGAELGWSPA